MQAVQQEGAGGQVHVPFIYLFILLFFNTENSSMPGFDVHTQPKKKNGSFLVTSSRKVISQVALNGIYGL